MSRYPQSLRRALYKLALEDNIVPAQGVYSRPAMRVAPFSTVRSSIIHIELQT